MLQFSNIDLWSLFFVSFTILPSVGGDKINLGSYPDWCVPVRVVSDFLVLLWLQMWEETISIKPFPD